MTLAPMIEKLLAQLSVDGLTEAQLFTAIYTVRFTGPLTIDFLNGIPQQINLGQPVRLAICHGERPPGVDKRGGNSAG